MHNNFNTLCILSGFLSIPDLDLPISPYKENTLEEDFTAYLAKLETWTRDGRSSAVLAELQNLRSSKIPREQLADIANLAFRNNQFVLALKFLNPIVRSPVPLLKPATVKELIIYGTSLLHLWAVEEAQEIFKKLDSTENPEIWLHRSFALFSQWNYAGAIPLLKKYIRAPKLTDYQRLIGQVNLAASYVADEQFSHAENLLVEILEKAQTNNHHLLYGNSLELRAQLHIHQRNLTAAKADLLKAAEVLTTAPARYLFYVRKAEAVCEVLESHGSPLSLQRLEEIRHQAQSLKQSEVFRDCDLFQAIATKDESLIHKIMVGTPHPHYRQRVIKLFGKKVVIPSEYRLLLGHQIGVSQAPAETLDLATGTVANGENLINQPILHQILDAMALDFYKPCRMGFLFARIFPGEIFDPYSSPHRILNGVHRLNKWFEKNQTSLRITVLENEFHLQALAPIVLVVRNFRRRMKKTESRLDQLHKAVGVRVFNSARAEEILNCAKPQILSILQSGLKKKKLLKIGQGRSTSYRFCKGGKAA